MADVFAFRHALIRQTIYTGLLSRERRALHALVAAALEHYASEPAEPGELAYHLYESANWERARLLSRVAGDRARALYASQAAAEHYTRALDAASHAGFAPDATLLQARGQAFDALGDFEAARSDFEAAVAAAELSGSRHDALASLLDLGLLWSGRDYGQAHHLLLRAIAVAREMADPAALGHALNRLGNWHANHNGIDEALRCHGEALAIFEGLDDRAGLAETLDLLAMTESLGGDIEASQHAARRATALFTELGDRRGLAGVLILSTTPSAVFELATLAGGTAIPEAIANGERALAIAHEIDWRPGEAFLLALLGEAWAVAGDFGKSMTLLRESIAIAEEIDHRQWIVQARWGLARLYDLMLSPTREREELERMLSLAHDVDSPMWIGTAVAGLASTWIELGKTSEAARLLTEVMDDSTPMRTQGQRLLWVARSELDLARERPSEALVIVDRLYATARNLVQESDVPWLAQLKAAALAALGDLSRAEQLLAAAQAMAREQGALPRLRLLHQARADVLRRQQRASAAQIEVDAAREIAVRMLATIPEGELHDDFARAAGLAAAVADTTVNRSSGTLGALTPREREIATEIAAGRSNREIAAKLFVSERTVEAHVTNILRKLGVRSRAGIATWTERQHLTPSST